MRGPYRWLEGDDDRVADWERQQNEYTDSVIQTDRRESLEPAFEELGWHESYFLPTVRGGRYFQRIEPAEAEQPRLTVRSEPDGDPRTLVDPTDLDETVSLQWFEPNWDGTLVVYGLMDAGTEQYDLRVLDVDDSAVVDEIDDVGRCNGASWDESGFYYSATGAAAEGDSSTRNSGTTNSTARTDLSPLISTRSGGRPSRSVQGRASSS
ncbi:hypothetical protein [Halovenus salina]|uniref:Peptidase S9A N-terminal domain-containing protein n=1 Tax=Halovenus salina TaxID=1510225 RepID=A0ABD5W0L4_9EURY